MATSTNDPVPPRLTPSPESFPHAAYVERTPSPPLRSSIYYSHSSSNLPNGGWRTTVAAYNPLWPVQFQAIATKLHRIFTSSSPRAEFANIEHIGSTSVPGLHAKPNIDILVTFPNSVSLNHGIDALLWELPDGQDPFFVRYTRIPNGGGIQGRESFKLYLPTDHPKYATTPEHSVYLINENATENPKGVVQVRCYRSLCDTLRNPINADLLREYAEVKLQLADEVFENSLVYSQRKDDIVRKILKRAGWTDEEVDEKEKLSVRVWEEEEPPY